MGDFKRAMFDSQFAMVETTIKITHTHMYAYDAFDGFSVCVSKKVSLELRRAISRSRVRLHDYQRVIHKELIERY